uniref:Ig-like domain-containing protein n=1 Tax=Leptobrachium leishanense TaxID=445787 RepID=A0A8C5QGB0_9ANUR
MDLRILRFALLLSTVSRGRSLDAPSGPECTVGCRCNLFSVYCCESEKYLHIPVIGSENATKLELNACPDFSISRQSLWNFPSLEELTVKSTPVTYVEADAFVDFFKLSNLFLTGLNLSSKSFHPSAFNDLPIQVLSLRNNSLATIDCQMFRGLRNLRVLDLSRNKIGTIQNQAFESLRQLSVLNLDYNNLKTVSPNWFKAFTPYPALQISIEGNDLTKECIYRGVGLVENLWFTQSLKPNNSITMTNRTAPSCATPTIDNEYHEIYIKESASITLFCSARGLPMPVLTWLLPTGQQVLSSSSHFSVDNGKLNISRVKTSDSGLYVCVATNSEGSVVALTRLSVITNSDTVVIDATSATNTPKKRASLVLLLIFILMLALILGFAFGYIIKLVYRLAKKNTNTDFEFSRFVDTPNILQVPENPQPMPHL